MAHSHAADSALTVDVRRSGPGGQLQCAEDSDEVRQVVPRLFGDTHAIVVHALKVVGHLARCERLRFWGHVERLVNGHMPVVVDMEGNFAPSRASVTSRAHCAADPRSARSEGQPCTEHCRPNARTCRVSRGCWTCLDNRGEPVWATCRGAGSAERPGRHRSGLAAVGCEAGSRLRRWRTLGAL